MLLNSFLLKDSSVSELIIKSNYSSYKLDPAQSPVSKPAYIFIIFLSLLLHLSLWNLVLIYSHLISISADVLERDTQIYITDNYHPWQQVFISIGLHSWLDFLAKILKNAVIKQEKSHAKIFHNKVFAFNI